jgi:small subunit ribosomal protein S17
MIEKIEQSVVAGKKRLQKGLVVSKKMQKTVTVLVERVFRDPLVGKVVKSKRKFHVHDPLDLAVEGDFIEFYEGRPVSKSKYMYLHKVLDKNQ